MAAYIRKHPPTDYWIFVCNPTHWDVGRFLESGEQEDTYKVSRCDRNFFRAGQLGVLRVNQDQRPSTKRDGRPPLEKGIYAIVEVLGSAKENRKSKAPKGEWRVPFKVVANLLKKPILITSLPSDAMFGPLHHARQTSSMPLEKQAFEHILKLAGVEVDAEHMAEQVDTLEDIRSLEERYAGSTPEVREQVSKRVERGPVGDRVKAKRDCRCQICEALGNSPVAFKDRKGKAYAEAHHVIPVHRLEHGSLSATNIMVLCPNHHRQAHFGQFEIEKDALGYWMVMLDGRLLRIEKTVT